MIVVKFHEEVDTFFDELIDTLFDKEYLGFKDSAKSYVTELIQDYNKHHTSQTQKNSSRLFLKISTSFAICSIQAKQKYNMVRIFPFCKQYILYPLYRQQSQHRPISVNIPYCS